MARIDDLWFSFDGVRSEAMGLRVTALPGIPVAEARGRAVEIPGRDGALWLPDGAFAPVSLRVDFELRRSADPDAVAAWLTGEGRLVLSACEGHYWRAGVRKGFELARGHWATGGWRASVTFDCQPFRYEVGDPEMAPIETPCTFEGRGTWTARPMITVYGEGSAVLMVNGASVLLEDIGGSLTLDCEAMMAFRDGENASPAVTLLSDDGWPLLSPGVNAVNWSVEPSATGGEGRVDRVVIRPNWRWR